MTTTTTVPASPSAVIGGTQSKVRHHFHHSNASLSNPLHGSPRAPSVAGAPSAVVSGVRTPTITGGSSTNFLIPSVSPASTSSGGQTTGGQIRMAGPLPPQPATTVVLPTMPSSVAVAHGAAPPTSVRMITSASITETTPSSASAVRPTPRIVIGSTHPRLGAPIPAPASAAAGPSTGASQTFVKQTPAGGQKQENLYIVALPEHLKRAGGVVQYTTQGQPMLVVNKEGQQQLVMATTTSAA